MPTLREGTRSSLTGQSSALNIIVGLYAVPQLVMYGVVFTLQRRTGHDSIRATSRIIHATSRFSLGAVTKITLQHKYRYDKNI
jgi:hypothetical protein